MQKNFIASEKLLTTVFYCPALNISSENIWSPPQTRKERETKGSEGKTALELLKLEQAQNGIVTFSAQIDEMLGKDVVDNKCNSIDVNCLGE